MSSAPEIWLGSDLQPRVEALAAEFASRRQTLATVECTLGGLVGHLFTNVAGASAWFLGAVVPYSGTAKSALLGFDADAFAGHGAVSPPAAAALAEALTRSLRADWTLAETGLTGPRGAHRSAKEPGTAFLHLLGPEGLSLARAVRTGHDDRLLNKRAFLDAALDLLEEGISTNVEMPVI